MTDKSELRRHCRSLPAPDAAASRAICERILTSPEYIGASCVFAFYPTNSEPDIRPLLEDVLRSGRTLLLPRCEPDRHMRALQVGSLEALRPGSFGILEPPEDAPERTPDLVIVPAVAYDAEGYRLGRGGGYYDRYLSRFCGNTIGVCCEQQLVGRVPREMHDLPVSAVVTEQRKIVPQCGKEACRMADQFDETRFFSLNEEEAEAVDALIADTKKTIEYSDILMAPNPEPEEETPTEEPEAESVGRPQKTEKPPRRRIRLPAWLRAMLYVFCVLGSAALLALFAWVCADDLLGLTKRDEVVSVTVNEGDTIKDIAQSLEDADLIEFQWLFRFYGWFSNAEEKIDPGTYELNKVFDYHALVNGMIATAETRATVTIMIPEGYECSRIFELLEEYGVCSAEDLYETAANHEYDYEFLQHLEYGKKNRLEGYLFPDTYEFYVDDNPVNVIDKFLRNFGNKYDEEMDAAIEDLNAMLREKMTANGFTEAEIEAGMMTREKVVIVASLIEKEAATSSERTKIASVIYNRLCSKLYPLLQIDATVQYALDERKEVLTEEDLNIRSDYNTYKNPGLPIGPIANPGLSTLKAALYPADSEYFFYALDTDGTHHFSETYYEHLDFLEGLG